MPSAPQKRRPTEDAEAAEAADRQADDEAPGQKSNGIGESRMQEEGQGGKLESAVNKKLRSDESDLTQRAGSSDDRNNSSSTTSNGNDDDDNKVNDGTTLPAVNGGISTVVSTQPPKVLRSPAPPPPAPVPMRVVPLADLLRKIVRLGDAENEEHAAEGKILTLGGQIIALVKQDTAQSAVASQSKSAAVVAKYVADCASNMPHKAPLYACLVAVVSVGLQDGTEKATTAPSFNAVVLTEAMGFLDTAVRDGEFVVVKAGLRFLGSLYNVGIFEEAAFWTVVDCIVQASEAACQAAVGQPQDDGSPRLRLASEILLFADGLMYAALACLPWAVPLTGSGSVANGSPKGSKLELLLQRCGQWMEERSMALEQLMVSASLQMESYVDDDTGQRLYASSALGELWQLICFVHGDIGEGNGSWHTAFSTSIPRPCARLPPGALEPRTAIGISAEQASSFEATCKAATQLSLGPDGKSPKGGTLSEALTSKPTSDASAKCVGRDRAAWDLDATVRAFQMQTTPDGPVYRAYETLSQVEMWVGRDRCNSILARFYPSGKLASRFLLGLQIDVQAPEASEKSQSGDSTSASSDSAAAVADAEANAAPNPSQAKVATKRVEPLIMETVFAHACMTPCHGRRWRMYLLDVAARLCQHTASGECPNEPGRRCTHKGYGKCLSTAVRAVFAGLPTLSPARRQLFAEWSAAFVAVREHRPTWPWEAMLDGIDFLSQSLADDDEADAEVGVPDSNGKGEMGNPYREFLQEVAALLSECTAMPILRGEVVPPELHAFLDAKFGEVEIVPAPRGRVGAMQSDMEELLLKGKSAAELEAWVEVRRQPPPPLTEEEKELEREAGGVFEDRTPPTAWECLKSLLNAAALAARGMLTRHLQLLLKHTELLRKLSTAVAASKGGKDNLGADSLDQVMVDIVAHTTATLQHCPRRATQVVRFLLMHRLVNFHAVVRWYFAATSKKNLSDDRSSPETAGESSIRQSVGDSFGENWKWEVVDACLGEVCVDEHAVANIFVNRVKAREDSVAAAAAALEGSRGAPQPVKQAWAVRAAEKAAKEATKPFTDEERVHAFGALLSGFVSALSEAAAIPSNPKIAAIQSRFVTTFRNYFHFYSTLGTDKLLEQLPAVDSSPTASAAVRTRLVAILRDPFL